MNILVVDGGALYARSWYAGQSISADPREAIRLAVNSILVLLDPNGAKLGIQFDKTIFAWDGQQNQAKGREPKPQVYHDTKDALVEVLAFLFGTVNAVDDEAEGDDIVATVVKQADPADTVYVVSSDKDLMQLVGGRCHYYSLHEKALLSTAFIIHKFHGIRHPNQVAIELAITGDSVDKIGGIRGYGPAKCKQLFKAVTPAMNFEEALAAVEAQLPDDKLEEFRAAFKRTLLNPAVAGVPAPVPLVMAHPEDAKTLGLAQIDALYAQTYRAYR
jgi:5'-3' exonuclease